MSCLKWDLVQLSTREFSAVDKLWCGTGEGEWLGMFTVWLRWRASMGDVMDRQLSADSH